MTNKPLYGPDNPHPLSQLKTELVWEGKYDEFGNRREVDIAGASMPLQKIETVDEPRSYYASQGSIFDSKKAHADEFRNKLIWGDNKLVMASLLKEYRGKIDLIYIDPPFDVGADFTMNIPIGDENENVFKEQSTLEMVAYRDTWGQGADSYLQMLNERFVLARELMSDHASIYVHCDWRMAHSIKLLLDNIFGIERYQNEIIWQRSLPHGNIDYKFGASHDTILRYSKSESFIWNPQYAPHRKEYLEQFYKYNDEVTGRRYRLISCINPNKNRPNLHYEWNGVIRVWKYTKERMQDMHDKNLLKYSKSGMPSYKGFLDQMKGTPLQDLWTDISPLMGSGLEKLDFPTQKPGLLLERIISASSNEGDLVADFFCGSGTTGAVAERLNRRWIMSDLGRFAIHTSRKRLIELQRKLHDEGKPYRAFDVSNLGRYERQWWQKESLEGADEEHRRVVLEFFKAEVLTNTPSPLIHGRKNGAFCHVDGIDSIFTREEAKDVAKAVAQAGGKEVYCLAWEFEMDLRLTTEALKKEYGVKLKLIPIPREIMEKNRKEPPPFLEMAVLEAEPVLSGKDKTADIKITKFMPSLVEVPTKELKALKERAIKSGTDFIDFWAIDFDWKPGKPFNHNWQDYRTRKDRSLKTISDARHKYDKSGKYTVCVKVVDTFGCDNSITLEIKV